MDTRLESLVHFVRGKNITAAEMVFGNVPVISAGLEPSGYHNSFNVLGPSITVSASGANAGYVLYHKDKFWAADCNYADHSENMLFAYYYMKYIQPFITNLQIGSAQPHVYAKNLNKLKVVLPPRNKYSQIATVLSRYDELIENNNKRITLLEDIAQEIYREWFVRFRFPGYKNAVFDNGTPKGWVASSADKNTKPKNWKFASLSNIGNFVRGKNITAAEMVWGNVPVISAGLKPSGYHNKQNVFGQCITISASGANAGYLSYHLSDIWAADCSFCQSENIWFIYNSLKFLQPVISNLQCGSAQPHVYPKDINKLCTIIPDEKTIKQYCERVDSIYDQIKVLKQKMIIWLRNVICFCLDS